MQFTTVPFAFPLPYTLSFFLSFLLCFLCPRASAWHEVFQCIYHTGLDEIFLQWPYPLVYRSHGLLQFSLPRSYRTLCLLWCKLRWEKINTAAYTMHKAVARDDSFFLPLPHSSQLTAHVSGKQHGASRPINSIMVDGCGELVVYWFLPWQIWPSIRTMMPCNAKTVGWSLSELSETFIYFICHISGQEFLSISPHIERRVEKDDIFSPVF